MQKTIEQIMDVKEQLEESIPCWHDDSDRCNEIPELATLAQMEQR